MRMFASSFVIAATLTVIAGCGGGTTTKQAKVSGKVTLDASPLASGQIMFDRADGTPPTILEIKNGTYEGMVPVGKNTVKVSSLKEFAPEKGKAGPGYDQPQTKETIAARFNTESRDQRDITEAGPNEVNVAVTKQ